MDWHSALLSSNSTERKDYLFEPYKITEVKYRGLQVPRPRSGHRIVCDDTNIYCFGGYNPTLPLTDLVEDSPSWTPEKPLFKELWSFSIAKRKWKLHRIVDNMPEELASNAMCMSGRYIMIYGGTGAPFGEKCSDDLITWRTGPEEAKLQIANVQGSRPPGQYGQAILCYDGYLYTIGGTNGFSYSSDIYRLDLRRLVWEPVYVGTGDDDEPMGRYRHEVMRIKNKLYVIGGGTGEWAFELMEVPVYDLGTSSWSHLTAKADNSISDSLAPEPRKCHSAVQIDTPNGVQVFVAGGSDGVSVFDDVWRLNVEDLQWTLMQKTVLPRPLYFHSATVTSFGCMYMFGGIEPKESSACRNNVMYKVWLCIPKLSEVCWEALMHLYPQLENKNKQTLLNIGIPIHLVERLL